MSETMEGQMGSGIEYATTMPDAVIGGTAYVAMDTEEMLVRRYSRRIKPPQELAFEFTRDPALLHQYYYIYEEQFRVVHNAQRYHSIQDEHDRRSHHMIVRRDNLCVGGARLSVKTPRQPHLLPIEMHDFRLDNHFPELSQKQERYGQIGRICLLPEFRGGDVTRTLFWHIYRKVIALNLDKVFGTAPISNARAYRQNCIGMGLKDVKIHQEISLPPYPMCEEVKFYLISGSVDKTLMAYEDSAETSLPPLEELRS